MNWSLTSGRVAQMSADMDLNRKHFSGLTGFLDRSIANRKTGGQPGEPGLRRVRKIQRLQAQFAELVRAKVIPCALDTPNDGFAGLKPLGVIERCEIERRWQLIYCVESGVATEPATASAQLSGIDTCAGDGYGEEKERRAACP